MINVADLVFLFPALLGAYIGYLIGILISVYLVVLVVVIISVVKVIYTLDRTHAYLALFVSTLMISGISIWFFGIVFKGFFIRPFMKKLIHIGGAFSAVVVMTIMFNRFLFPLSPYISNDFKMQMKQSYTMTNLVPLTKGIFPQAQTVIENGINNFMVSMQPRAPEEIKGEKTKDDKAKEKKGKPIQMGVAVPDVKKWPGDIH